MSEQTDKPVKTTSVVKLSELPAAQYITDEAYFLLAQNGTSTKLAYKDLRDTIHKKIDDDYQPTIDQISENFDELNRKIISSGKQLKDIIVNLSTDVKVQLPKKIETDIQNVNARCDKQFQKTDAQVTDLTNKLNAANPIELKNSIEALNTTVKLNDTKYIDKFNTTEKNIKTNSDNIKALQQKEQTDIKNADSKLLSSLTDMSSYVSAVSSSIIQQQQETAKTTYLSAGRYSDRNDLALSAELLSTIEQTKQSTTTYAEILNKQLSTEVFEELGRIDAKGLRLSVDKIENLLYGENGQIYSLSTHLDMLDTKLYGVQVKYVQDGKNVTEQLEEGDIQYLSSSIISSTAECKSYAKTYADEKIICRTLEAGSIELEAKKSDEFELSVRQAGYDMFQVTTVIFKDIDGNDLDDLQAGIRYVNSDKTFVINIKNTADHVVVAKCYAKAYFMKNK